jgi:hypothetical protein
MKKILGDEFSFFGNGDDTLLPAAAALVGFAAKPADPVSAPSFLDAANNVLQAGALTVSSFDVAASNGTFMTTTLGSGHMSASAEPAANNGSKYGSSGAGPTGGAFAANSQPAFQNDPQSGVTGGAFPNPETVTLAGSGLVFVNTYGAGVTDPFHTAIIYAEHELQSDFTNSVTIRVSFDFGDAHGFLAYNSFFNTVRPDYTTLKNALSSHATSPDDIAAINAFPAAAPSNTHSSSSTTGFLVAAGMARVLGLAGASSSIDDALILGSGFTWNFDPNNRSAGGYDAIGAIEHEISEGGMGRVGGLGYQNNTWAPMDLFRFTSAGQRDYTGGQDGVTTYFSPDGANPDLTHPFHNSVNAQGTFDGADPADWQVGGDSFGFGSQGVPGLLSATDLRVMDVLGWTKSNSVSISDATITEGNSGSQVMTFTVTRSGGTAAFAVNFVTSDGSAFTGDGDYNGTSGTLNFGVGVNTQPISVTINGDTKFEANETFSVNLSGVTNGATISDGLGIGTIINDDAAFAPATFQLAAFAPGAGGWSSENQYPRAVADVSGDGMADIVGFGANGVIVSLATGNGQFGSLTSGIGNFGYLAGAGGWTSQDQYPRLLGDVDGDGKADIIGFGANGVIVSLATGNGHFAAPVVGINNFGFLAGAGGWTSENQYPRLVADVNGDHMADIVGFGANGVIVSLATGNGHFAAPVAGIDNFAFNAGAGGWTSEDQYPRLLADIDGDHMADIVGFGANGVIVSLATGNGHFAAPVAGISDFAFNAGGWVSQDMYPRALGDVNGNGAADIIGFGQAGIYEALSNGGFHLA